MSATDSHDNDERWESIAYSLQEKIKALEAKAKADSKRIAELDDIRQHFENKYSEQCQINVKLRAENEALRDAMKKISAGPSNTDCWNIASAALAAFDEVHKDE